MEPDSATLFCRDSKRALSGCLGFLHEDERVGDAVGVNSSRPISRSAQTVSATSRSPLYFWMVAFTCKNNNNYVNNSFITCFCPACNSHIIITHVIDLGIRSS